MKIETGNISCPSCNMRGELQNNLVEKSYRGETFEVREFYYKCSSCFLEYTDDSIDTLTVEQVYNSYREKYKIPFPEELIDLRKLYGLSQREMGKLLAFGQNLWSSYENGEIPNKAHAEYIDLILNPSAFKTLYDKHKNNVDLTAQRKIEQILNQNTPHDCEDRVHRDWVDSPNKFTGYRIPSFEKFTNLINHIVSKGNGNEYRTKLNKIVKYCDFTYFKRYGKSITGCKYAVLPYGVCPSNHDVYYGIMIEKKTLKYEWIDFNGNEVQRYLPENKVLDESSFNATEIDTINEVLLKLTPLTRPQVIELDHLENEWSEEKIGTLVDYTSTFELKAF